MPPLSLDVRITLMERQLDKLSKDLEEEKVIARDYREKILAKLTEQDKILYKCLGILAALQFLAPYIMPLIKK